ncbi:TRAP transporter substrate-binding protein [Flexithrix dorotheae]|uniref:TRAP transporter substrate-binding protein n=1 Tax=Flexithrix dorotheae TaxID=70993 RepID=UPI000382C7D7|nr:TRAP transporter substrate-binding protein [Flexithrix dorotheae]
MKFTGIICLQLFFLMTLLIQCSGPQEKDPEFLFRASLLMNENHTWFKGLEHFSALVLERSEGRIKVEVYPSEQLGKESEAIRMIQAEIIDLTTTGALLNNWMEIAAFCEMPFLIKDSLQKEMLINGPIGKRIKEDMIKKTGLRPIAYFQTGPRMLTSNRPIKHPDDLNGLIVRVPNVPSFVTAWQALGAKPTPMAFSEVFTSLQQGTIEAQENPLALIDASGFSEVQQYVNLTAHVNSWSYVVVGEKQFKKLPDDLKTVFLECAQEMQKFERKLYQEDESKIRERLKSQGMIFIESDKAAFSKAAEEAIFQSLSPEMQKVYKEISVLGE